MNGIPAVMLYLSIPSAEMKGRADGRDHYEKEKLHEKEIFLRSIGRSALSECPVQPRG